MIDYLGGGDPPFDPENCNTCTGDVSVEEDAYSEDEIYDDNITSLQRRGYGLNSNSVNAARSAARNGRNYMLDSYYFHNKEPKYAYDPNLGKELSQIATIGIGIPLVATSGGVLLESGTMINTMGQSVRMLWTLASPHLTRQGLAKLTTGGSAWAGGIEFANQTFVNGSYQFGKNGFTLKSTLDFVGSYDAGDIWLASRAGPLFGSLGGGFVDVSPQRLLIGEGPVISSPLLGNKRWDHAAIDGAQTYVSMRTGNFFGGKGWMRTRWGVDTPILRLSTYGQIGANIQAGMIDIWGKTAALMFKESLPKEEEQRKE